LNIRNRGGGLEQLGANHTSTYNTNTGDGPQYSVALNAETYAGAPSVFGNVRGDKITELGEYVSGRLAGIALERAEAAADGRRLSPERERQLNMEEASLNRQLDNVRHDRPAWRESLSEAGFTAAEINEFESDPSKLNTPAVREKLMNAGLHGGDSRPGLFGLPITGSNVMDYFGDKLKVMAGFNATSLGEVDPATGNFLVRTYSPGPSGAALWDSLANAPDRISNVLSGTANSVNNKANENLLDSFITEHSDEGFVNRNAQSLKN
jgi:hypothetical protein